MPLHLYRRHNRCCGSHPAEFRSSQFDERKKGWKKCPCPITASGVFPDGKFRRKSTGEWQWERAQAVASAWEKGEPPPPPLPPSTPAAPGASIAQAAGLFLKDQETAGSAKGTITRYTWLMRKIQAYSQAHGVSRVEEWTKVMVREFAASWGHGPVSVQKTLSQLKGFFYFCEDNDWITRNPADIRRHRNRANQAAAERLPYTDAEIARMYDACHLYRGRRFTGEDLADFIAVAIHTGLRRSDVAGFQIDRLNPATGEVRVRTTKYGTHVHTWVPEWLQQRMLERARRFGPCIFGERRTLDPAVLGLTWYVRLRALWALAGPWAQPPNVHRFRHTFIRILLEHGYSTAFVADLVGDNEPTIRRHYAAWVPERQAFVTNALRGSFAHVPQPGYAAAGKVISFDPKRHSA